MKDLKYILVAVLISILYSCNKTDEDIPDLGYNYYPLETGNHIHYHVVEYIFDDFTNSIDTLEFDLLEGVGESYIDAEGRTVFKLHRYVKDTSAASTWQQKDVWIVYKGSDRVERVEENVTFVKMIFPLRRGKSWDGNARNDSASQIYKVLDYDLKNEIGGTTFGQTSRINQKDNINLIEEQFTEEIYARGIGLVQRIERNFTKNPSDSSKAGYEYQWVYVDHFVQ